MWILAVLWWKQPRLAQNLILWFFGINAASAAVAAPARLYLRFAASPVPYDAPIVWDAVGLLGGPLVLVAVVVIAWERTRYVARKPRPAVRLLPWARHGFWQWAEQYGRILTLQTLGARR